LGATKRKKKRRPRSGKSKMVGGKKGGELGVKVFDVTRGFSWRKTQTRKGRM